MELPKESHASHNRTSCIHLPCDRRPHFGGIINFFNLNLDLVTARSADDRTGLITAGGVAVVDCAFRDGSGSESGWIGRHWFLSQHNLPCFDAFQDAATLSLPGGIVGTFKDLDSCQGVLVGLRGHGVSRLFVFLLRVC